MVAPAGTPPALSALPALSVFTAVSGGAAVAARGAKYAPVAAKTDITVVPTRRREALPLQERLPLKKTMREPSFAACPIAVSLNCTACCQDGPQTDRVFT
jgi:hypothetical protein